MAAFLALVHLALLPAAFEGAYYGHKPHPQQHQPLPQMPHMGMGKDISHMLYPHYRKDLPMHLNKGKDIKGMKTCVSYHL